MAFNTYTELLDATAEEIMWDWLEFMEARDPRLRDTSVYTFNRVFAEGVAVQLWTFKELLKQKVLDSGVMTATGTALDAVVADRLPAGRHPGTYAEGIVKFSRDSVATYDILIPKGTRVAAIGEGGEYRYYVTTDDTTIPIGERYGYAHAEAEEIGIAYNVGPAAINIMVSARAGVQGCTNDAPFTGGTDRESDDEFRARAIYTIWVPGRATIPLVTERLTAISGVREARAVTVEMGDVLLVIDANVSLVSEIEEVIYDNLAAGITAPGVLGAELRAPPAIHQFQVADCSGAYVWARPREYIPDETVISFTYLTPGGASEIGSVTIPAGTPRGTAIKAGTQEHLAAAVTSSTYAGFFDIDLFMGLGTYPYLWVQPELQEADVDLEIVLTSTAETDLLDNISASLEAALDDYKIGDQLEFADLVKWIYIDYETGRPFRGIDDVSVFTVECKGSTMTAFGDSVSIDSDERVVAGTIAVGETT